MIRFSSGSWFSSLFVYYGGVLPKLVLPTILYLAYTTGVYYIGSLYSFAIAPDGLKLLASSTTFMLVFRLNQCHSRLQSAEAILINALCGLRGIVSCACSLSTRGDLSDEDRQAATLVKVHVCRLAIAFAVSLKYHMRAAEMMNSCGHKVDRESLVHALSDLVRLKSLLTEAEAKLLESLCGLYEERQDSLSRTATSSFAVDINRHRLEVELTDRSPIMGEPGQPGTGGTAIPPYIANLMRMALREPLAKPWGYPERVLNIVEGHAAAIEKAFRGINQIVSVPLPLPYLQLCKLLLLIFIAVFPWSIDLKKGPWSNIFVPAILAMTLLGFEIVADFMENPLGDDSADISVYETIHEFEVDVEAIFNCSEGDRSLIMHSWHELGDKLGLAAGCSHLTQPKACPSTARFTDYFVWVPLPEHTVDYIAMQSTDIGSLHRRIMCEGERGGDDELTDSSEEEAAPPSGSQRDVYAIRQCVALRASLPHLKEAAGQRKALEKAGRRVEMSFREAMDAGRTSARTVAKQSQA